MAIKKVTQKQTIFYHLYKKFKEGKGEYIPVFQFMGEVYVEELKLWGFMSHECSPRTSELRNENPDLVEHTEIVGKSGAHYYGWRIKPGATPADIKDPKIKEFFNAIKRNESKTVH